MIRHFSLSWYPLYLSQEINGQGMAVGGVGGDMHESLELFWQTSTAGRSIDRSQWWDHTPQLRHCRVYHTQFSREI